jgi:GT2 family glycosyltransferase
MANSNSILRLGNDLLRSGRYSDAIQCYADAILNQPELARLIIFNTSIARKREKAKHRENERDVLLISTKTDYVLGEILHGNTHLTQKANATILACQPNRIDIHDINGSLKANSFEFDSKNFGRQILQYVLKSPCDEVILIDASPLGVLVAFLFLVIWKVRVVVSRESKSDSVGNETLAHYIAQRITYPEIAIVALGLEEATIELMVADSTGTIASNRKWTHKFASIKCERDELVSGSDGAFLDRLFEKSMGRKPREHELRHLSNILNNDAGRRSEVAYLVCQSDESTRHTNDRHAAGRTAVYSLPEPETIEPDSIRFPYFETPEVSILIPVYGKLEYTLTCLESLANNPSDISFEILVLDDQSPDDSANELAKVENVRVIVNPVNLGFVRSCNHGAKQARGKYLCFLNNDTVVKPGWLDELHKTFKVFPGAGLVGSKLIYPDGNLQEAGGIIWQDGSAWNFGNMQDPGLPQFCYAREVDYVSGAAIMVPAELYAELDGFDGIYAPAYCEDSDLALKIRDRGYRVIYQPMSEVVHFEGVTSGTDTTQGIKAYQVANSKTLFERWKGRLATHRPNGVDPDNEKDRRMRKRALVLEHCTPTPDQDAGSVSVFNILLMLREMDFQVTFIAEDNFLYMPDYTTRLQRAGIEVLYAPYTISVEQHLQEKGHRYDLAFLFRPVVVERHIATIKKYCLRAKTLFYTHDIHHLRMTREAELLGDHAKRLEADDMKRRELAAIRAMDATIIVSPAELEILHPQLPGCRLEILPLLLNIPGTQVGFEQRKDFCFVGGFQHTPNVDAVQHFVAAVMPAIRKKLPGVKFHIVGSKPPETVKALAAEDIVVHGFIEDLNSLLDQMRLSVAPLRYGAGVKGKVGTALAAGLPSVLSDVAAEGMQLLDGVHALVANDSGSMAEAIVRLYTDPALWQTMSESGLAYAESAWGPLASFDGMHEIIRQLFPDFSATPKYPLSLYNQDFA